MSDDAPAPSSKRRKTAAPSQARPRVLEGAERSSLVGVGEWVAGKEMWLIRVPKDVRFSSTVV